MHKALLLLKKIPKGKVTTYGALAKECNSSPRAIGQVMRHDVNPDIYPCFKVVKSSGEVGGYFGQTKGKAISRKISLLKKDGIKIEDGKIDKKYFYKFIS